MIYTGPEEDKPGLNAIAGIVSKRYPPGMKFVVVLFTDPCRPESVSNADVLSAGAALGIVADQLAYGPFRT